MSLPLATARRAVVTGMGAMTPLGNTLHDSWKALLAGENAMTSLEAALQWQNLPDAQLEDELNVASKLNCQVAAPCKNIDQLKHDPRTPRFVQLALTAGQEALQSADLLETNKTNDDNSQPQVQLKPNIQKERVGVCIGSGMSGVREIVQTANIVATKGVRRVSPHFVPKVLTNSAAGRLSLMYGLRGPNHAVSTACAAGTHALGDALRCLQYGNADVMLAGGAEACIDPWSMAGFAQLKALSTQHPPEMSSRPFDVDRDGFVMGEGAAVLVLETLEHALARQAPILAELCGYGLTGDAYHITAPDPNGGGAERAMRMALEQAACGSNMPMEQLLASIGYVNAHATSTPKGDEIEAKCIDRLFSADSTNTNKRQDELFVSSTKGATGHLLGAAGAIEAAFTVLALQKGQIPPTHNLHDVPENEQPQVFSHVFHNSPVHAPSLVWAMSNSFGFGGTNASIVLKRYQHDDVN